MKAVHSTLPDLLKAILSQKQNVYFRTPISFGEESVDFSISVEDIACKAMQGNVIVVTTDGTLQQGCSAIVCNTALLYAFYEFTHKDSYFAATSMLVPCLFKHYNEVSLLPIEEFKKPPIKGEAFLAYANLALDMLQKMDTRELEKLFLSLMKQEVLVLSDVPPNINIEVYDN